MGKLFIGTSGWIYSHWEGIFYPEYLPSKEKLKYFARHFNTVEINYSFYHLPRPTTYQTWYQQTPENFVFAVKASKFITHIKRLKGIKEAWKIFLERAFNLKEKLGPVLFQFPPSFKATPQEIKRLNHFLKHITASKGKKGVISPLRFAFEFRHSSWCEEKIYRLLNEYGSAWVIADSPRYPKAEVVSADFVYIRMHGSKVMFSSDYTSEELNDLAKKIRRWLRENLDVYCYFNNDAHGYAVKNAQTLKRKLTMKRK